MRPLSLDSILICGAPCDPRSSRRARMDPAARSAALQSLQSSIVDAKRTVTYKSLSLSLQCSANDAKALLAEFATKEKQTIERTFVLAGERRVSPEGNTTEHQILLVRESELERTKRSFVGPLTTCHVYAIAPKYAPIAVAHAAAAKDEVDGDAAMADSSSSAGNGARSMRDLSFSLYTSDLAACSPLYDQSDLMASNALRDNRFSGVANTPAVTRTRPAVVAADVSYVPRPPDQQPKKTMSMLTPKAAPAAPTAATTTAKTNTSPKKTASNAGSSAAASAASSSSAAAAKKSMAMAGFFGSKPPLVKAGSTPAALDSSAAAAAASSASSAGAHSPSALIAATSISSPVPSSAAAGEKDAAASPAVAPGSGSGSGSGPAQLHSANGPIRSVSGVIAPPKPASVASIWAKAAATQAAAGKAPPATLSIETPVEKTKKGLDNFFGAAAVAAAAEKKAAKAAAAGTVGTTATATAAGSDDDWELVAQPAASASAAAASASKTGDDDVEVISSAPASSPAAASKTTSTAGKKRSSDGKTKGAGAAGSAKKKAAAPKKKSTKAKATADDDEIDQLDDAPAEYDDDDNSGSAKKRSKKPKKSNKKEDERLQYKNRKHRTTHANALRTR